MPLNYSKWDALELSDDSDVEVHPNVDKKSFIRMKQRKIHEEREERKQRIAALKDEAKINADLLVRIEDLIDGVKSEGTAFARRKAAELQNTVKAEGEPVAGQRPSYDLMVFNLLQQVFVAVKGKNPQEGEEWDQALSKELDSHRKRLKSREEKRKAELEKEEKEARKYITSEDLHDGFDVSRDQYVDKKPSQAVSEPPTKPTAKKTKGKSREIEVLNPAGVAAAAASAPPPPDAVPEAPDSSEDSGSDSDSEDLPDLAPEALAFSKIKSTDYQKSYQAISQEPSLYINESTTDALLVEAFNAELRGNKEYARQCVHQGLLLQYCRKLGKDGVALFFRKVMAGQPKALSVFLDDVQQTYTRISGRCAAIQAERAAAPSEQEQIQLVAQDPSVTITFEIPDGPPPEHLTLEGEGVEDMDVDKVKEFLQQRWDTFEGFPKALKKALKTKRLDEVNKVLGKMKVPEAEGIVEKLDQAGILSFVSSEIRDETGGAPGTGQEPTSAAS